MEFLLDIERNGEMKDYLFEIQSMDNFLYTQAYTSFGIDKNYKEFATKVLNEMVVSPMEARNVNFFKEDFEGLMLVVEKIIEFQDGFMKPKHERKGIRVK